MENSKTKKKIANEEKTVNYKAPEQTPPVSQPSKLPSWLLIITIISFILVLLLVFSSVFLSSNTSATEEDINNINDDLGLIFTDVATLQNKTTDLTYSDGTSSFANNLNVGGTLTNGGKNLTETLAPITYDGNLNIGSNLVVTSPNDLFIGDMNVKQEIDDINEIIITNTLEVDNLVMENITVNQNANINNVNANTILSTTITSDVINSTTITSDVINSTTLNSSIANITGLLSTNINNYGNIDNAGYIMTNDLIAFNGISTPMVAGYSVLANGGTTNGVYPLLTSMKKMFPYNITVYWVLNPGFKFVVYERDNYTNNQNNGEEFPPHEYDNSYGPKMIAIECQKASNGNYLDSKSIKIYYRETLVTLIPELATV